MKKINKSFYYSVAILMTGIFIFPLVSLAQASLELNDNVNINALQKVKGSSTLQTNIKTEKATGTKIDLQTKNEIKAEEKNDGDKGVKLGLFNSLWNSMSNREKNKDFDSEELHIENLKIQLDTNSQVTFKIKTNEDAKLILVYSTSSNLENAKVIETEAENKHSLTLNNLDTKTVYYYKLTASTIEDTDIESGTFTTKEFSENNSDVDSPLVFWLHTNSIKETSAMLGWITFEKTTSKVWLETDQNIDTSINADYIQNSLSFFHKIDVTSLESNTTYYFKVISIDKDGNETVSAVHSFTTKK